METAHQLWDRRYRRVIVWMNGRDPTAMFRCVRCLVCMVHAFARETSTPRRCCSATCANVTLDGLDLIAPLVCWCLVFVCLCVWLLGGMLPCFQGPSADYFIHFHTVVIFARLSAAICAAGCQGGTCSVPNTCDCFEQFQGALCTTCSSTWSGVNCATRLMIALVFGLFRL